MADDQPCENNCDTDLDPEAEALRIEREREVEDWLLDELGTDGDDLSVPESSASQSTQPEHE